MVINLKGISEAHPERYSKQTLSRGHLLVELSLARLFNSHWHECPTVIITIIIIIITISIIIIIIILIIIMIIIIIIILYYSMD